MSRTVSIWGVDYDVEFDCVPYTPATWDDPAEGGEVEVTGISLGGYEITDHLSERVRDLITRELERYVRHDMKRERRDSAYA